MEAQGRLSTEEIMKIFQDPLFQSIQYESQVEMMEIDF